ncbi:MAG: MerC domain-containing protein [Gammaproteobacteria bacterium]
MSSGQKANRGRVQDVSAIVLSTVCALHCAAIPIVIGLLPAGLWWLESEWVHRLFVLFAVPVSGYAIVSSLWHGSAVWFAAGATVGLALLAAPAVLEHLHDYETVLTLSGATVLATAHLWHWRTRRERRL